MFDWMWPYTKALLEIIWAFVVDCARRDFQQKLERK